jgi:hypothetical protein
MLAVIIPPASRAQVLRRDQRQISRPLRLPPYRTRSAHFLDIGSRSRPDPRPHPPGSSNVSPPRGSPPRSPDGRGLCKLTPGGSARPADDDRDPVAGPRRRQRRSISSICCSAHQAAATARAHHRVLTGYWGWRTQLAEWTPGVSDSIRLAGGPAVVPSRRTTSTDRRSEQAMWVYLDGAFVRRTPWCRSKTTASTGTQLFRGIGVFRGRTSSTSASTSTGSTGAHVLRPVPVQRLSYADLIVERPAGTAWGGSSGTTTSGPSFPRRRPRSG